MISVVTGRKERDFVVEYVARAPLALALERALECRLLAGHELERPILDVGCGDGCFADVVFGGQRIDHGLDADPAELAMARKREAYERLHLATGSAIPLPDASMRTVISNSTLEHIPDVSSVLEEIGRVTAPGGSLYVTVPTDCFDRYSAVFRLLTAVGAHGAAEAYRRAYDQFWKHFHFYEPSEWAKRIEAAGYEIWEIVEYDGEARCLAHDLLVPLALPSFLLKKMTGHWVIASGLRLALARALRPLLPSDRLMPCSAGTGGLVFFRAVRSARRSG